MPMYFNMEERTLWYIMLICKDIVVLNPHGLEALHKHT